MYIINLCLLPYVHILYIVPGTGNLLCLTVTTKHATTGFFDRRLGTQRSPFKLPMSGILTPGHVDKNKIALQLFLDPWSTLFKFKIFTHDHQVASFILVIPSLNLVVSCPHVSYYLYLHTFMLFRSTCLWHFSVDNPPRVATDALNIHLVCCIYSILRSLRLSVRQDFPGRKVENRFCTVLYRFLHLSPDTGRAGRRILSPHWPGGVYCLLIDRPARHGMASLAVLHKCIKEVVAKTIFISYTVEPNPSPCLPRPQERLPRSLARPPRATRRKGRERGRSPMPSSPQAGAPQHWCLIRQ